MRRHMSHTVTTERKRPRAGTAVTPQRDDHAIAWLTSLAVLTLALLATLA
jgi:hypothetical protein